MTQEEISIILDTYMYLNYQEAADGMKLQEILAGLEGQPEYDVGGTCRGEYEILSQAVKNPEIGELVIGNQSHLMGYDTGTCACTFSTADSRQVFVVYRGTGDGEWPDNGLGMTKKSTLQQERALQYFEEVVEKEQIGNGQTLIVTGHSKGGNKAQYVTMSTKYGSLLDACYNVDGQGFSEKAIQSWRKELGEEEYWKRTGKITGIYGENDYVSALGTSIVPEEKVHYVRTPVKKENFAGYHDIKYLFASLEHDPASGGERTVFGGSINPYVEKRGELGSYAASLSALFMGMEAKERAGCAASLMQLMELGGEKKTGLNGEKLSVSQLKSFLNKGVPTIAESLIFTREGNELIRAFFMEEGFYEEMKGRLYVAADYRRLAGEAAALADWGKELKVYKEQAAEILKRIPEAMSDSWLLCNKLKRELRNLESEIRNVEKLSETLIQCIQLYVECDTVFSDELLMY